MRHKSANHLPKQQRLRSKNTSLDSVVASTRTNSLSDFTYTDCPAVTTATIDTSEKPEPTTTTSSGYGTSSVVDSALSVFVNLDNYFYDENFSKYKHRAQESALEQKRHVVLCFLQYQFEYLEQLQLYIENFVRPLRVLMEEANFFQLFQNIEKIFSMTEFIKNAINDSMSLTLDIYKSTVHVIYEYVRLLK